MTNLWRRMFGGCQCGRSESTRAELDYQRKELPWATCGKPVRRRKYPTRGCERKHGHYGNCWIIRPYDNEYIPSTLTGLSGKRR